MLKRPISTILKKEEISEIWNLLKNQQYSIQETNMTSLSIIVSYKFRPITVTKHSGIYLISNLSIAYFSHKLCQPWAANEAQ